MPWPRPEFVLYVLGAFLVGYGISLAIRASRARRWAGPRDNCPDCNRPWNRQPTPDLSEPTSKGPGEVGDQRETDPDLRRKASSGPASIAPSCSACGADPPAASAINAARRWIAAGLGVSLLGVVAFLGGIGIADWMAGEIAQFGGRPPARLGPILGAGFGISLFGIYVAILAYRGQRSRGRRRCPKCWYLIDEALGLKCSECGHEAKDSRDLFKPRRRWKLAMLGLLLVALGQLGWMESRVRRGGWLAAVPTEVLIVGMPWLPREWLIRVAPAPGDDWTLTGRVSDYWDGDHDTNPKSWEWHRPWASERAAAWLRSARNSESAARRLQLLTYLERRLWTPTEAPVAHDALLHTIELGIDCLSVPGDLWAGPLVNDAAQRSWFPNGNSRMVSDTLPGVSELVDRRTPDLLAIVTNGPPESRGPASLLLGMGDGRPEVFAALADLAETDEGAASAISWLAGRNPHSAADLAKILADPGDARRLNLARSARWLVTGPDMLGLDAALMSMLASPDPVEALRAAETLMFSRSAESKQAAFDRAIEIAIADPSTVDAVIEVFGYVEMPVTIDERQSVMLGLAGSDNAKLERLALFLFLSHGTNNNAALNRAAIDLIEEGVPAPAWMGRWSVPELKSRFQPRPAQP